MLNKKLIMILVLFLAIVCIFTIASVLIVFNKENENINLNKNQDKNQKNNQASTLIKKKNKIEWEKIESGEIKAKLKGSISTTVLSGQLLEYDSKYIIRAHGLHSGNYEIVLRNNNKMIGFLNPELYTQMDYSWDVKSYYDFENREKKFINKNGNYDFSIFLFSDNNELLLRSGKRDFGLIEFNEFDKSIFNKNGTEYYIYKWIFPTGLVENPFRYVISLYNPDNKMWHKIFENDYRSNLFFLNENKIYYINDKFEIEYYDLLTSTLIVIETDNRVKNLIANKNKIFYLIDCDKNKSKSCMKLNSIDLVTKQKNTVVENIYEFIDPVFYGDFYFKRYNDVKNTLEIISSGGDGPCLWGKIWELNLKKIKFKEILDKKNCCTNEDSQAECLKFKELFSVYKTSPCSSEINLENSTNKQLIGCFK